MTGTAINTKAAVEVVKSAAGILPAAGKAAVLTHLLSEMTAETLKALSPETRTKLLADLQSFDASAASALELRKQAFLDTYSVKVLDGGPHQVSFTIPEGKSRMDLINDAHDLAQALYNRPGVHPNRLANWRNDQQYTQVVTQDTAAAVEGCVPNSTNMTRYEHESKERNWNDVDIRDLAAAQQAFFVATGKDLLDGMVVRARGGALDFNSRGLVVDYYDVALRYSGVAASRSLPLPN